MSDIPTQTDVTNHQLRIMELEPEYYESAVCFLCGSVGENVDWYWTVSPESHRTYEIIHAALTRIREWPDSYDGFLAVQDLTEKVDPIAFAHDDDFPVVCSDCASATRSELRRRIRAHADQLDEAGYSAPYGPDSDDLTDPSLRDQGLWVRRHVGYELVVHDGFMCQRCPPDRAAP